MKLKSRIFYIDTHNKNIYFFTEIGDNDIKGISWATNPSAMNSGSWAKSNWEEFITQANSQERKRFDLLKNHTLTKLRKRRMIQQLFEIRLKV